MEVNELISHPSVQREFERFRRLGGSIEVDGNKIFLFPSTIPIEIAQAIAERIRKLDEEKKLEVTVRSKA